MFIVQLLLFFFESYDKIVKLLLLLEQLGLFGFEDDLLILQEVVYILSKL